MATKKAAESTLYHLSPQGFWKKLHDVLSVNPEISSGLPIANISRYPPPGSRPEKYSTPATKASDPAQNPYWKRDVRRAYPQLSVITQSDLSTLLIEHSTAAQVSPPTEGAVDKPKEVLDLSAAISTVTSTAKVYSESKLPPSVPVAYKNWVPERATRQTNPFPSMSAPPPTTGAADVYLSKTTNTWRYEKEDGTEMEYDTAKGAWVPLVDEDLVKRQQAAYSIAGVDEDTPAAPILARENKKRKQPEDYTSATAETDITIKRGKTDKKDKDKPHKSKNTAVYVTGLPIDAELDEIIQCFSKYGLLEEDADGEPKVKMYAKDDGSFMGEALVVYFKEDSVSLAVSILDESELRLGDPSTTMRVSKAEFAHKASDEHKEDKPRRVVDKKKATKRIVKMQKKLQEWVDEDGFGPALEPEEKNTNVVSRVVVLKHMFTLEDLEKDASLLLDLKEDVREECSTMGQVTNVVLYDKEKDGIMTVKFRDPISAQACVIKMNGRWFDGRQVEATLYTGKQRFQKSGMNDEVDVGDHDAERKRLDSFAEWLLTEGD